MPDHFWRLCVKKFFFVSVLFALLSACFCGCSKNNDISYDMYVAPYNHSIAIPCKAEPEEENAVYQWYESKDGKTSSGVAVQGATDPIFTTPLYTEKGIRYYYCTATTASETSVSEIATVAYTALPTVYINTPDSIEITSKEDWIKGSTISIVGANDESWNFNNVETSIKGRGNSTWERPKKPYSLKLKEAQKIMGMPKHKRWVLLANYADNSFMRNVLAFYLSELFEFDWTPHGEFVDLVINGRYNGLYWLGEAVKVDKNRVDIDDGDEDMEDSSDKDYLLEMDIYFDETVKFKSAIRDLPYMIKNDDYMIDAGGEISSGGQARLERLQAKINTLERLLYPDFTEGMNTDRCSAPNEAYASILDIDSWAKFWFINEIMDNKDFGQPKSVLTTFESRKSLFKAGPVWDFDWTFYTSTECQLKDKIYYNALFKSPAFTARTKELWNKYAALIDIETTIEPVRSRISTAAEYNIMLWGIYKNDTGIHQDTFDEEVDLLKRLVSTKIKVMNNEISNF